MNLVPCIRSPFLLWLTRILRSISKSFIWSLDYIIQQPMDDVPNGGSPGQERNMATGKLCLPVQAPRDTPVRGSRFCAWPTGNSSSRPAVECICSTQTLQRPHSNVFQNWLSTSGSSPVQRPLLGRSGRGIEVRGSHLTLWCGPRKRALLTTQEALARGAVTCQGLLDITTSPNTETVQCVYQRHRQILKQI